MEKVMKYVTGFLGGLVAIMMAIVPVTVLWTLLTGTTVRTKKALNSVFIFTYSHIDTALKHILVSN